MRKLNVCPYFSLNFRVQKLRFLAFPEGPGGFRKLKEAGRNHFHLSWYLLVSVVTSYDQKLWGGNFSLVAGSSTLRTLKFGLRRVNSWKCRALRVDFGPKLGLSGLFLATSISPAKIDQ